MPCRLGFVTTAAVNKATSISAKFKLLTRSTNLKILSARSDVAFEFS